MSVTRQQRSHGPDRTGTRTNSNYDTPLHKLPATRQGIAAMEKAAYRGVNVKATASFTVAQARGRRPVDPEIIAELYERVPDFRKAYGATMRTLRGIIAF